MSTVFELIDSGSIPGEFIWRDELCFAIMDINPFTEGHALVIPRQPVDKWTDLPSELRNHIIDVAADIGRAQEKAFGAQRSVLVIEGFAVPHVHLHVAPANGPEDVDFHKTIPVNPGQIAESATRLRSQLRKDGHGEAVPG